MQCLYGGMRSAHANVFGHRLLAWIAVHAHSVSTHDAASHLKVCCTVSINSGGSSWAVRVRTRVGFCVENSLVSLFGNDGGGFARTGKRCRSVFVTMVSVARGVRTGSFHPEVSCEYRHGQTWRYKTCTQISYGVRTVVCIAHVPRDCLSVRSIVVRTVQ